ncbi:MAG: addiction module protein [Desulforegulaceae bacterium]|nr:addiction module protein [Desulforegulaceae bacterium]
MSELLKQIENQVLTLPAQERAFLADRLLSSLNEDSFTDNEAEWIIEAEKTAVKTISFYIQNYQKTL